MQRVEIDRTRRTFKSALVAVLLTGTASSGCLGPHVVVIPSGPGVIASPKASDCQVDFFRTKVDRPYDEIAALHVSGADTSRPDDFQDALRAKACEVGADAVIVTQDYSSSGGSTAQMNAVAIKYRDAPGDRR